MIPRSHPQKPQRLTLIHKGYFSFTGPTRWSLHVIYRDKISHTAVTISSAEAKSHLQRLSHIHRAKSHPQRLNLIHWGYPTSHSHGQQDDPYILFTETKSHTQRLPFHPQRQQHIYRGNIRGNITSTEATRPIRDRRHLIPPLKAKGNIPFNQSSLISTMNENDAKSRK